MLMIVNEAYERMNEKGEKTITSIPITKRKHLANVRKAFPSSHHIFQLNEKFFIDILAFNLSLPFSKLLRHKQLMPRKRSPNENSPRNSNVKLLRFEI